MNCWTFGLELVHNCLVNDLLDSGDRGKKLHVPLVQDGLDGVVVNLFHHERDRDDNIRLDIRHGLEQRGRCGGLAQIIDGHAAAKRVQELEHHAVDMAHGEHRDDAVLLAGGNVADGEIDRGTEGFVLKHDALRGTGSTRCIVDDGEFALIFGSIIDVLGAETSGVLGCKYGFKSAERILILLVSSPGRRWPSGRSWVHRQ